MNFLDFLIHWNKNYFSAREKRLLVSRIFSFVSFTSVILIIFLEVVSFKQLTDTSEIFLSQSFWNENIKVFIYHSVIAFGLFTNLIALQLKGKYAIRFAEVGILIAFFAWFGHFVWTQQFINELNNSNIPLCFPPVLLHTPYIPALILTLGFIFWFFYKIIFLIAVTWKTVRK